MPFEFCSRHSKRYERGISVCAGCHAEALDKAVNTTPTVSVMPSNRLEQDLTQSNVRFDKRAYMREYMRKRRATS